MLKHSNGVFGKITDTELINELEFLVKYYKTKKALKKIIDMPDQKIDQFIRFCVQNNGNCQRRKNRITWLP